MYYNKHVYNNGDDNNKTARAIQTLPESWIRLFQKWQVAWIKTTKISINQSSEQLFPHLWCWAPAPLVLGTRRGGRGGGTRRIPKTCNIPHFLDFWSWALDLKPNISNAREHEEYEILASPSCMHTFMRLLRHYRTEVLCRCCAGQTDRKYAVTTPTLCRGLRLRICGVELCGYKYDFRAGCLLWLSYMISNIERYLCSWWDCETTKPPGYTRICKALAKNNAVNDMALTNRSAHNYYLLMFTCRTRMRKKKPIIQSI